MKKIIALGSVFVLMLSVMDAFAALPKPKRIKVSKAATRKGYLPKVPKETAPAMRRQVERKVTQAKQTQPPRSFLPKKYTANFQKIRPPKAPVAWTKAGGKTFYDNQADLVRDVAHFYGEEGGQAYRGILGEDLILYKLPKGIVYHPAENLFPRVLDPNVEYIMYDPVRQSGSLMRENILCYYKKVE